MIFPQFERYQKLNSGFFPNVCRKYLQLDRQISVGKNEKMTGLKKRKMKERKKDQMTQKFNG